MSTCNDQSVTEIVDLLSRPTYGMSQVDRLLALKPGTARRWIDGYERGGKFYQPVIRADRTENDVATWGEFVETRLLAEYRNAGVNMLRLRPAIVRLREQFGTEYPLAHARPFVDGLDLVLAVQDEVALDRKLLLVVQLKDGQVRLSGEAATFKRSVEYSNVVDGIADRVRPQDGNRDVFVDPLRQFGEPVVRSVPTEVIAEQVRAGDRLESIAENFELTLQQVESAVRFELWRAAPEHAA